MHDGAGNAGLIARRAIGGGGGAALVAALFPGEDGRRWDSAEPLADFGVRLPAGLAVFLCHGAADTIVSLDHLRFYAKAIPQATIRLLANCDHPLGDAPSDVARDFRHGLQSR